MIVAEKANGATKNVAKMRSVVTMRFTGVLLVVPVHIWEVKANTVSQSRWQYSRTKTTLFQVR